MSWTLRDKPRTLKVSKALAKEFAEMDPAPHDRPLSERRLQVYARILNAGSFRPVAWARAYCVETGGTYRVNGKHTSTLLAGLAVMPEFYVTVEDYTCETLEDVAKLYATFDSKIQSRTSSDINLSFAATVPELSGISARTINASVAGMAYHTWSGRLSSTQPAERAELLLEHTEFVLWLHELISGDRGDRQGEVRHLVRQPVVGAMFATYQKAKLAATQFWNAVRDETGAQPSNPDRKLARYLTVTNVGLGQGAKWGTRHSDSREMYVKCLHAWNAWRKGETTNLNYYADKDVPAVK